MVSIRLTLLAVGAATLSACSSLPLVSDQGGQNFATGSVLSSRLSGDDISAQSAAFLRALETGTAQQWSGRRAIGEVRPGSYSLANLKLDPTARIPASRRDLDLSPRLETDLGLYVLTRNSNIRTGPGTDNAIAGTASSGAGVEVVGKVTGGDWMLVAIDGVIRGYIYDRLMIKAPGRELELAGGPRREARLCREFDQTLSVYSETDKWSGAACRDDAGNWRLAPPEPGQEGGPQILLTD